LDHPFIRPLAETRAALRANPRITLVERHSPRLRIGESQNSHIVQAWHLALIQPLPAKVLVGYCGF
jgi:hypothetical protein